MATPMQTQDQQGGFSIVPSGAATPVGVAPAPVQAVPNGRSPHGKRPRSDMATSSGPVMNPAETAAAVSEMRPLVQSTAEAVQWNCDLLNALIIRVNTIEGWTQVAEPAISAAGNFVTHATPKLAELDGFGTQIREALSKVEEVATRADARLRTEIDAATGVIDTAIGKLKAQVDELAPANAASRALPQSTSVGAPSQAPGLNSHERLDTLHARSEEIA